jgi:hypothetical protein
MKMINIEQIMRYLPVGYEKTCYETKAIERNREIKSAEDLMTLSMVYLTQNNSLLEMSEIARIRGIAEISDVAYMKRFAKCGEWFKSIIEKIKPKEVMKYEKPEKLDSYRFKVFDASDVCEKGATKRLYRLHYAIDLFTMTSDEYKITDRKTGESATNFTIGKGDVVIGDRGYGSKVGIEHCLSNGGDFIFRIKNKAFKLYEINRNEIILMDILRTATEEKAIETTVYMENTKKELIPLRLCAKKKTPENIKVSAKKLRRSESKRQLRYSEETHKTHEYIFVITSLPEEITADEILDIYRLRWQVELYFKRLKSIIGFGNLPLKKEESIFTWLNGKLMIALLIEKMISLIDFSPDGKSVTESKYMAGNEVYIQNDCRQYCGVS